MNVLLILWFNLNKILQRTCWMTWNSYTTEPRLYQWLLLFNFFWTNYFPYDKDLQSTWRDTLGSRVSVIVHLLILSLLPDNHFQFFILEIVTKSFSLWHIKCGTLWNLYCSMTTRAERDGEKLSRVTKDNRQTIQLEFFWSTSIFYDLSTLLHFRFKLIVEWPSILD